MREYLLVLTIAVAVTYLVSGLCRRLALRTGALARVRDPLYAAVADLEFTPDGSDVPRTARRLAQQLGDAWTRAA